MEDLGEELGDLEVLLEKDEATGKLTAATGLKIEREIEELEVLAAEAEERGPAVYGEGPRPTISRSGIEKKIAKVRAEVPE